jgi:hypothetical protein
MFKLSIQKSAPGLVTLLFFIGGCRTTVKPTADRGQTEALASSPLKGHLAPNLSAAAAFVFDQLTDERRIEIVGTQSRVEADCMRQLGYEYVETPPLTGQSMPIIASRSTEFMAQFGYGRATLLHETDLAASLLDEANSNDPNSKLLNSLSPSAQKLYTRALVGEVDGQGIPLDPYAGCVGKGEREAESTAGLRNSALYSDSYQKALDDIRARVLSDARHQKALASWSNCMKAATGYDLESPDRAAQLVTNWIQEEAPRTGSTSATAVDRYGRSVTVIVPTYGSKLPEISQRELLLASNDRKCDDTSGLTTTVELLQTELSTTFVEKYFQGS